MSCIVMADHNGIDGVYVKYAANGQTITDVVVNEAKFSSNGVATLPRHLPTGVRK